MTFQALLLLLLWRRTDQAGLLSLIREATEIDLLEEKKV
jgi:hypothetical protein